MKSEGKLSLDPAYLDALRFIYPDLSQTEINWVITGSLGFALQGVPVSPNDIDLQTDATGAYEIEQRFSDYIVRSVTFSGTERIRSHFGALRINGINVEIMGDILKRLSDGSWEAPVDLTTHKRIVVVEGMRIPVLSLAYEMTAYLKLGRKDKAEMLREFLKDVRKEED